MARHLFRRLFLGLMFAMLATILGGSVSHAQTVSTAYETDGSVQKGMIVMLDPKNSKKVLPLSNKTDNAMQGVAVAANDTIVSFAGDGSVAQVFIATEGKYDVLVSTQNGPIKAGDIISVSALDGIGMKADAGQSVILGKALGQFDGSTGALGSATLKTNGGTKKVAIGLMQVDIGISHNPLAVSVTGPPVPAFLKKAGDAVSGKPVSTVRLYAALGVLFVTGFMTASLLYGGVRSSLVAIGRNPLAKKSILRGLIQVVVLGMIVFVIGLFAIYLLLKL